ncbi:coiled-coil domain-containing protein 189 isoform X1 [Gallus gallus]|uniref:coiled-coil domain-containing protein 189 isoform X1 n=1 Tax=Gallus gallus TaxID=9031 RepID=UPI0003506F95|nr:coiled-coil domain-containing protein 189 isoform X1 [Gallus gallus]XP_040541542.1 coiled-coil domain-containing protein 189 isoform X1 [Gallus gallus]|eukprot:XP_024997226.1 coiled-coil domain-containing protein 189 isoform X3 [Gallus gallus]
MDSKVPPAVWDLTVSSGSGSEPDSCETRIRLWTDLDVGAVERLQAAPTLQDRRAVLAEVLPGPPVLLDAYEAAVELGQELELSPGPLSALLGIVRCAISMCTQTPLPDVEECYAYCSELLLCHAVHVSLHPSHAYWSPGAPYTTLVCSVVPASSLHTPHVSQHPHSNLNMSHEVIGIDTLHLCLLKPTWSSHPPHALVGLPVFHACFPFAYLCPQHSWHSCWCLHVLHTFALYLIEPAHSCTLPAASPEPACSLCSTPSPPLPHPLHASQPLTFSCLPLPRHHPL